MKNTACPAWATACVDLTNNTTWLQSNGKIIYGPVAMSSGRPGYRTPAGTYRVYWKDKNHVSSIYDASMPNAVFFNGGVAFHEGDVGSDVTRLHPPDLVRLREVLGHVGRTAPRSWSSATRRY